MKKLLIVIPLLLSLIIYASIPLFADSPINNVDGSLDIYIVGTFPNFGSKTALLKTVPFGTNVFGDYTARLRLTSGGDTAAYANLTSSLSRFTLNLKSDSTVYLLFRTSAISATAGAFGTLDSYHDSSSDISVTFSGLSLTRQVAYILSDASTSQTVPNSTVDQLSDAGSYTEDFLCTYVCFRNIPAGTYTFFDTSSRSYNGEQWLWLCVGVYVESDPSMSSWVDGYVDGSTSFGDALSGVNTSLSDQLKLTTSVDQQTFLTSQAQYQLDRLILASDQKNLQYTSGTLSTAYAGVLASFENSTDQSVTDAIIDLNKIYSESLSNADTAEHGSLANTSYLINLNKLEIIAKKKASDRLSSAVSDIQVDEAVSYYDSEEEIISQFDSAELSAILDFKMWSDLLPSGETQSYRSIFEYLINDSKIRQFITIPVAFVLVSVLFGSVIRYAGRSSARGKYYD